MSDPEAARRAALFGPTTGGRLRLADMRLVLEVERDLTVAGEEAVFGGGKSVRDGMAQGTATRAEGAASGRPSRSCSTRSCSCCSACSCRSCSTGSRWTAESVSCSGRGCWRARR